MTHYVEIRAYDGDVLATRMGPMSEPQAERVEDGANRNLNHEEFYTRIVTNDTGEFPDEPSS